LPTNRDARGRGPHSRFVTSSAPESLALYESPLAALLAQPGVTDVLVNGPDSVWIDAGSGLHRVAVRLGTRADVRELAVRLAAEGGRRLDDASPTVDARLPDGTRLHAAIPPIADDCTSISLRAVRRSAF